MRIGSALRLSSGTRSLLEMNFSEARHFLTLLRKAGELDEGWLTAWKTRELGLLTGILNKIPTYRLVLPLASHPDNQAVTQASLLPMLDELVQ